jgi:hypothetical protein
MHLNKLSTAALMRLSVLASLNLLLGRWVDYWLMLHPLFFLIILTLNLGLYALMVYTGTLNKTLIAMMLAGLAGVLAVIAFSGAGASAFMYGGPFRQLAMRIEELVNATLKAFPRSGFEPPPKSFWWAHGLDIAYLVIDAVGLAIVLGSGLVARVLQARTVRREPPTAVPSS